MVVFFIKASAEGVAVASNVLAGTTFSNDTDTGLVGTMPNRQSEEYPGWRRATVNTPSISGRVHLEIPLGAYITPNSQQENQVGVFCDEPNFIASNLLSGKTYFGLAGGIPFPKGWQPNNMINGTAQVHTLYFGVPTGYYNQLDYPNGSLGVYAQDTNYIAQNIISGKSIFGLAGSATAINPAAGDAVLYQATSMGISSSASGLAKCVGKVTINYSGSIRIKFGMTSMYNGTAYAQIYRNGIATGTMRSVTGVLGAWVSFTEDFICNAGDYFEIYYSSTSGVIVGEQAGYYPTFCVATVNSPVYIWN